MLRCCFFSTRHLKESRNFGILGFVFLCFCQIVKSFQHGKCKQQQTTKIARLRKLLGNLLCDMVLGSGIAIRKQVNCNLEGKVYVPMDSIKRMRKDSNLKLRIRVRSVPRIRANSGRIRIRANSCEFEPASLPRAETKHTSKLYNAAPLNDRLRELIRAVIIFLINDGRFTKLGPLQGFHFLSSIY